MTRDANTISVEIARTAASKSNSMEWKISSGRVAYLGLARNSEIGTSPNETMNANSAPA